MRVSTRRYVETHGFLPRGHGTWLFGDVDKPDGPIWWSPPELTYPEAKRAAIKWFREQSDSMEIEVLP